MSVINHALSAHVEYGQSHSTNICPETFISTVPEIFIEPTTYHRVDTNRHTVRCQIIVTNLFEHLFRHVVLSNHSTLKCDDVTIAPVFMNCGVIAGSPKDPIICIWCDYHVTHLLLYTFLLLLLVLVLAVFTALLLFVIFGAPSSARFSTRLCSRSTPDSASVVLLVTLFGQPDHTWCRTGMSTIVYTSVFMDRMF